MSHPLGKNVKNVAIAHAERKDDDKDKPRGTAMTQLRTQPQPISRPTENPTTRANKLFQTAKALLESSGNLKSSIKEGVMDSLSGLYETVLQVDERLRDLDLRLERLRSEKEKDLREKIEEKDRIIEELARNKNGQDIGIKIKELITNTESIKKMINHDVMNRFDEYPPGRALCGNVKKLEGLMDIVKEIKTNVERTNKRVEEAAKVTEDAEKMTEGVIKKIEETSMKVETVGTQVGEVGERVKENGITIRDTGKALEALKGSGSATYAETARAHKPRGQLPPVRPNHALIVSSSQEKDTSDNVIEKVREALDARNNKAEAAAEAAAEAVAEAEAAAAADVAFRRKLFPFKIFISDNFHLYH
ncbi:hypothetical protein RR46_12262 [Papilio xuthus]|uniref:Uncharacterized protein n=1 Tax=Papilio xuthus TaxID=66420 RepID=A0A194PQL8_PAPXU|nr:hypothetical protein RR46_12262 [Papilio xuthus]